MKYAILLFAFCLSKSASGQVQEAYADFVKQGDSLYDAKQYKASAFAYSKAFESLGGRGYPNDRYNAACSWALAGYPDSAFHNLQNIAAKAGYSNYAHITTDADLNSLHSDARWPKLLQTVRENKSRADAGKDTALIAKLERIHILDQYGRTRIDSFEKAYGRSSPQMTQLWADIQRQDSINLIEVSKILDTRGWLGPDTIGSQGSTTLFLVIQHSDSATQAKYLPVMRAAVAAKKASGSQLALLEDRLLLKQGKKQIYGSQIGIVPETGKHYVQPLEDPDNVDKRRAQVGLGPLAGYVRNWGMTWDADQYKKELSAIMKLEGME